MIITHDAKDPKERYIMIDLLRGLAVLLMLIFHLVFDLNYFQFIRVAFLGSRYWIGFAQFIVFIFLVCVGMGLSIVHKHQIKWDLVKKRFYRIGGWALIITIITYILFPKNFVFFGVLHCIATTSVVGVLFVNRPRLSFFLCLALVIPNLIFQPTLIPISRWIGVTPMDYIPFYPWIGIVFLGIYLESVNFHKIPLKRNLFTKPFEIMGKHSLKIYLLHQPILVGMFFTIYKMKN